MEDQRLTVNLIAANLFALVLFGVAFVVSGLIWMAVWGGFFNNPDLILDPAEIGGIIGLLGGLTQAWILLIAIILGIVVHELIHGITWACYTEKGWKSINFGVIWKMLTPYCHCKEPLQVRPYVMGALMPLWVLGIIPMIFGICFHCVLIELFGIIFVSAAGGDILVAWKLRKVPNNRWVMDHPTEAGCIICDNKEISENNG